jgi:hypothetical protein
MQFGRVAAAGLKEDLQWRAAPRRITGTTTRQVTDMAMR